ncbi:hypothetical protein GCM10017673_27450 [Streptosporangium violaceochromogenes]|nr:hypothetical protein GCM10017673_27450 [Streptosporangium violaceochromogenes]
MSDLVTHFIGAVPVAEGATFAARGPVTGRRVREVRQADPAVPSEPTTITIRLEPRG